MHTGATFEFLGGTNDAMETKIREAHHLVDQENVCKMIYCRYHLVQDFFQQYALDPISQITFSKIIRSWTVRVVWGCKMVYGGRFRERFVYKHRKFPKFPKQKAVADLKWSFTKMGDEFVKESPDFSTSFHPSLDLEKRPINRKCYIPPKN